MQRFERKKNFFYKEELIEEKEKKAQTRSVIGQKGNNIVPTENRALVDDKQIDDKQRTMSPHKYPLI